MRIHIDIFRGMSPKIVAHLLDPSQAQYAKNCRFESGAIVPLKAPRAVSTPAGAGLKSIHYVDGAWVPFTSVVSLEMAPTYNSEKRFFYTGAGTPRRATRAGFLASGAYFNMGIPKPTVILTINLQTDPGQSATPGTQARVSYVYCFVDGWGQQGPPSDPTAITDIEEGQYLTLTGRTFPADYAAAYNIVGFRVYRLNWGTQSVDYQELYSAEWAYDANTGGHIDDSVSTVTDRTGSTYNLISSDLLGDTIQSEDWLPPSSSMGGLTLLSNGVMGGFVGNEVVLSDPFIPYGWPHNYAVGDTVVALSGYDSTIVAVTTGRPWVIECTDPANATPYHVKEPYPGQNIRGITSGQGFVAFISATGLIHVSSSGIVNLTDKYNVFTDKQWDALTPSNMLLTYYDGKYYIFNYNLKTGFTLDFNGRFGSYVPFEISNKVLDVRATNDGVYMLTETDGGAFGIEQFDDGSTNLEAQFKSKKFRIGLPDCLVWAMVRGTFTSVTFYLYGNSTLLQTKTVTSESEFLLVDGKSYDAVEAWVVTDDTEITSITLATSIEDLQI